MGDWVEEKRIVDPEAKKPDDWDDEEDGDWEAPMKDNPAYKGDWMVKRISNPAYKGFWQVKGNTIFDNIIITDDAAEADSFAKKWKDLSAVEKAKKKEEDDAKKAEDAAKSESKDSKEEDDDDDDDDEEKKESEDV